MSAINFLIDADGRHKAIVIDLDEFKHNEQSGEQTIEELLEELEDLLDIERTKNEETIPWVEVEAQLRQKGIID